MAATREKSDPDFVGSFEKGLRVIQAFDSDHARLTLSEVAERTELDRAAARRFLLTLVTLGFAAHDGKRFRLTPRVMKLGYSYVGSLRIADAIEPELAAVSDELDESASAAVLDEDEIVYIARVQTRRIMSMALGVGARLPAAATSMGRVLLAELESAERKRILAASKLERHSKHTIANRTDLERCIRGVRDAGYALVDQELEEGLRSIAVPVRNGSGQVVAAMNGGTWAHRVKKEVLLKRHLDVLLQASQRIQSQLI